MEPGARTNDYATRADLDRIHQSLSRDLLETERLLRERDDEKERSLRAEFVDALDRSDGRTRQGFIEVKAMLEQQNRWIMRDRFAWAKDRKNVILMIAAALSAALIARYLFGVV